MKLSGWARYPVIDSELHKPDTIEELALLVRKGNVIARGNGRSYGDSAVSHGGTIDMRSFNRLISFDQSLGQLVAEVGVLLADVIDTFLPRGWFPNVVPGTKFVTLGGMVAADIHGKNHHLDGSFGNHIDWLDVFCADGELRRCSLDSNPELFKWTIGGMGLTGIIVRVAFRLKRVNTGWIEQKTRIANNISETMECFAKYQHAEYSVAWIDCLQTGNKLGRSIVMLGEHCQKKDLPKLKLRQLYPVQKKQIVKACIDFPSFVLNRWTVRVFNLIYFWNAKIRPAEKTVELSSYFFPLDWIANWNRLYGKRGFMQFQCVIPIGRSEEALQKLLTAISQSEASPFLAVLKRFGNQDGHFSFPMEGYTLAVDFAVSEKALRLMKQLELITLGYDGRFYLAKDGCLTRDIFEKSDKRIEKMKQYRNSVGAVSAFRSAQSDRLGL
ncbi:FAD-binding oxidoreductase [Alphaproteobacteria bacterium]|nr:FAD-binding oxidoreductase [Alphaproteobacteria bacterium]